MNPVIRLCLAGAGAVAALAGPALHAQDEIPVPTEPPLAVTEMPPPEVVKGYLQLGFDRLSGYEFILKNRPATGKPPQALINAAIPEVVRSWSGKKADLTGYMVPTKMDKGLVVEFLMVRDMNSCCYGVSPALNHFVLVRMAKGVAPVFERVVKVSGTFKVNTTFDDHGYMVALYEVTGEKVVATGD